MAKERDKPLLPIHSKPKPVTRGPFSRILKVLFYILPVVLFVTVITMLGGRRDKKTINSKLSNEDLKNNDPVNPHLTLRAKRNTQTTLPTEKILPNTTSSSDILRPTFKLFDGEQKMMIAYSNVNLAGYAVYYDTQSFLSLPNATHQIAYQTAIPNSPAKYAIPASNNEISFIYYSDPDQDSLGIYRQPFYTKNGTLAAPSKQANYVYNNSQQSWCSVDTHLDNFKATWQSWLTGDIDITAKFEIRGETGRYLTQNFTLQVPDGEINSLSLGQQMQPVVKYHGNGASAYAWVYAPGDSSYFLGDGEGIYAKLFSPNNSVTHDDFVIHNTSLTGNHNFIDLTDTPDGYLAVWNYKQTSTTKILMRNINLVSGVTGQPVKEYTGGLNNHGIPSLASFPNGATALAFDAGDPGNKNVYLQFFNDNQTPISTPIKMNTNTLGSQTDPHIEITRDKQVYAVWNSKLSAQSALYATKIDPRLKVTNPNPTNTYTEDTRQDLYPNVIQLNSLFPNNVTVAFKPQTPGLGEFTAPFLPFISHTSNSSGFFTSGPVENVNIVLLTMAWKPALDVNSDVITTIEVCQPWLGYCQNTTMTLIGIPVDDPTATPQVIAVQKTNALAIGLGVGIPVASVAAILGIGFWRKGVNDKAKERAKHPLADAVRKALGLKNVDDFQTGQGKQFLNQINKVVEDLAGHAKEQAKRDNTYTCLKDLTIEQVNQLTGKTLSEFAGYIKGAIDHYIQVKNNLNTEMLNDARQSVVKHVFGHMKTDTFNPTKSDRPVEDAMSFESGEESGEELKSV